MPALMTPRHAVLAARTFGGLISFTIRPGRSGAKLIASSTFDKAASASTFAAFAARMSRRNVALRTINPNRTAFTVSCPVICPNAAASTLPRPIIPCPDPSAANLSRLLAAYGYPTLARRSRGHGLPPSMN